MLYLKLERFQYLGSEKQLRKANYAVAHLICACVCLKLVSSKATVKFLNFRTPENFAVIYLKFKQRGQTFGYFVKMMQME